MSGFYVSLIFLGVLLVIFSFICIFLEKRKVFSFVRNFEVKKQELVEIINDAEQMIEELNKFSDYIVNQMELKNEELYKNMENAEKRLRLLETRAGSIIGGKSAAVTEKIETADEMALEPVIELEVEPAALRSDMAVNGGIAETAAIPRMQTRKNDKVIPIYNKYSEVSRLSKEGLYSLEIAKKLNMGKGEVELILGLRK